MLLLISAFQVGGFLLHAQSLLGEVVGAVEIVATWTTGTCSRFAHLTPSPVSCALPKWEEAARSQCSAKGKKEEQGEVFHA